MIKRFVEERGRKYEHVCRVDCSYMPFAARERAKSIAIEMFRQWCRSRMLPLLWIAIPGSGVDLYVDRYRLKQSKFVDRYGSAKDKDLPRMARKLDS